MCQSEVALIEQKIIAEYEAMKRGLSGYAGGAAQHAFIDAHMQCVDRYQQQLEQLIGEQEANEAVTHLYIRIIG